MLYPAIISALILFVVSHVNGDPAVPTRWRPGNWNGQVGRGLHLLSIYKNITPSAYPTSRPNNACALNCTREPVYGVVKSWLPMDITATITAATIVHIVNTKRNTTRDITITNTEADLTNFTAPSDTNSHGTRTFLVTDVAPDGVGFTTYPVAFPTLYTKYSPQVTFSGALPTIANGTPTCLRAANQTSSSFPTHPTLAQSTFLPMKPPVGGSFMKEIKQYYDSQNLRFDQDPKGWTWSPDPGMQLDVADEVKQLMPNLGIWSCKKIAGYEVAPASYLATALYLTRTTTMSEGDDGILSTHGSVLQPEPGLIPLIQAARAAMAAAHLAPSPVEAQPTPAEAGSPLFSKIQSALRIPEAVPAATPGPQLQSGSNNGGPPRAGNPITAPAQANGVLSSGGAPPIEVGRETITPNANSQYVVSGQTLGVGSSITLGSGPSATVVGLQASGSQTELVVGSSTSVLPPLAIPTPPLTVGGQVYQANDQGQYIIGGQTLTPGGAVEVNGTPISLPPGATQLVVGSSTENLEGQLPTGTESSVGSQAGPVFIGIANARTLSLAVMVAAPGLTLVLLLL